MYAVAGESFRASFAAGSLLSVLMVVLAISMMAGIVYNIMAALSTPAVGETRATPFTKGFFITNVSNLVISLVIKPLGIAYNIDWPTGVLRILWALMLGQLIFFAWSESLKLRRTRIVMAAGAGRVSSSVKPRRVAAMAAGAGYVKKSTNRKLYWRSLKSLTGLVVVVIVGLLGLGVISMIDIEQAFFPESPAFAITSVLTELVQFYSIT
jgi:hypothetical protein